MRRVRQFADDILRRGLFAELGEKNRAEKRRGRGKIRTDLKTPKLAQFPQSAAFSIEKQSEMPFSLSAYICFLFTSTVRIRLPVWGEESKSHNIYIFITFACGFARIEYRFYQLKKCLLYRIFFIDQYGTPCPFLQCWQRVCKIS